MKKWQRKLSRKKLKEQHAKRLVEEQQENMRGHQQEQGRYDPDR